jgi:hypothetical protein
MRSILIATLLLVLAGCNSIGTWQNEQIPPDVQAEVTPLIDRLIAALRSGNENDIRVLCSDRFVREQEGVIQKLITEIPDRIRQFPFTIRHRQYTNDIVAGKKHRIETGTGDHDFAIDYTAANKESYAVVLEFQTPVEQYCALIVYGKNGSEWKINILYIGNRFMENKDVYDWYRIAEKHFEKGNLADAALDVLIIRSLQQPAGKLWHYAAEDEIEQFCQKVEREASEQFAFPVACEAVASQPGIYSLNNRSYKNGIFPVVEYVTGFDLEDSLAIKEECRAVHASIDRIFPGITRNNKMIVYRSWDKSVLTKAQEQESPYHEYVMNTH